jgi:FRG domain
MSKHNYCNAQAVCEFLAKHRMAKFTSYGKDRELVRATDGSIKEVPALKPKTLFRGQIKAFDTLRPSIYRKYSPNSTWQEMISVGIDDDRLVMPHPHYSMSLERDFYYSQVKAAEVMSLVEKEFVDFPHSAIDGIALCQHYGLPTACLDFSEDVWISGFFATHEYRDGSFLPCGEGIGVMYVLETDEVPSGALYEIGIQPLPRPYAQRGSLLKVTPEINLLSVPAVWAIFFKQDNQISKLIGERYRQGRDLVPHDEVSSYIEGKLASRKISREFISKYVDRVPLDYQLELGCKIQELFAGHIEIE